MNEEREESEKGFTVTDRRFTTKSTPEREEIIKEEKTAANTPQPPPLKNEAEPQPQHEAQAEEVTFSGLIFSLSHSALMQMGEIPDPMTKKKEKHLAMAKQTIDLIALLEVKTRGNLSKDEEVLIKNALYDLRIRFVQNSR